jgi:NAD(P)-dependent dehydrogenase (short-subunit alcohol dehydrogenase family)
LEAAKATLPTPRSKVAHNIIVGDVSEPLFWDLLTTPKSRSKLGAKVDVLINCAGIAQNSLLVRTSPTLLDEVVRTNLGAVMLGVRALLKSKKLRRDEDDDWNPVVINLASLLALKGGRGAVAYSASKAGILGLTHALCAELGPLGIRVNAIVPGYVETDMTKDLSAAARDEILDTIPLKRFGTPAEIAEAALFLATNQYANNCVMNLDGGLSAV